MGKELRHELEWVTVPNVEWECQRCGGTYFHHIVKEGARYHVLRYDSTGVHCSEEKCEVNHKCKDKEG